MGRKSKKEGTYVCVYLIHLAIWQKLTQHCEATVCVLVTQLYLTAAPGTVAHQAPLSMQFSRQVYWSG